MTLDRVSGAALSAFGLAVLWESRALPLGTLRNPGPGYLPVVLALLVVAFGAGIAARGAGAARLDLPGWREWGYVVAILGSCAFAALALERIGYRLTMALVLAFLLGFVERRSLTLTAVLAVGLAAGSFFLFNTLLRVPLPRGPGGL